VANKHLNQTTQSQAQPQGEIVKPTHSPALDKLQVQLQNQADQLEDSARQVVRNGMAQAKLQVRSAISEELEAVAGDDDFFDISSLFGSGGEPERLEAGEPAEEAPIEVLAVVS
jgi:hypothetical protein